MKAGAQQRERFEEVALPLAGSLFAVAVRLTGRREDAEEVTQETFLRAYRTFENFREGSNARAWLFTILYSIVKNRLRSKSRRPLLDSLSELEEQGSAPLAPTAWGSHEELLRSLDDHRLGIEFSEAFARLAPASRMIVLLVEVGELEYDDVARIVKCPVGTVASRLYRARKQLYEALSTYARATGHLKD